MKQEIRCLVCDTKFETVQRPGRPKLYCSPECARFYRAWLEVTSHLELSKGWSPTAIQHWRSELMLLRNTI